ncbi:SH3 domain-containing protein [Aureimonas sp. ME7]|uniref:SH3 domain-containing protein n=1 Tax=Aureimonas sp. ME7 TaxID=2744252 RepID=UPI001FCEEAB5|nr:SH3 domain-containing protein [Aureimonas sp. ME7]
MSRTPLPKRLVIGLIAAASLFSGTAHAQSPAAAATPPASTAPAAEEGVDAEMQRKLPLPRFVSLKSARVNLRVGPGKDYAVSWLYLKPGLPVEVIQEYDLWRRIRDAEGTEGWVYHSLLSGERTALAAPWLKGKAQATIAMHRSAASDATVIAEMEPGVVTKVRECSFGWCEVEVSNRKGFVSQNEIWGVYPDERF